MPFFGIYITIALRIQDRVGASTEYPYWPISGCKELQQRFANRQCYFAGLPPDFEHGKRSDASNTVVPELINGLDLYLKGLWSWQSELQCIVLKFLKQLYKLGNSRSRDALTESSEHISTRLRTFIFYRGVIDWEEIYNALIRISIFAARACDSTCII